MANFIAVYDTNMRRRSQYVNAIKNKVALFDNLKSGSIATEDFDLLWAAAINAPVDFNSNNNEAAIVFGDPIKSNSIERATAPEFQRKWKQENSAKNTFYDGYYAAVTFSSNHGLRVGGDILGLFPLYFYSCKEIILAGSSPELFKYHPAFRPKLCYEGLAGMLMTMHSVEGYTLWEDTHRLKAGHLLIQTPEGTTAELLQYQIPLSDRYFGLSFSQQVELIHSTMQNNMERHAPADQKYSLLFSGGLDSRMLGGYLQNRKKNIKAVTLGVPSDTEMKMAKKALKALKFSHETYETPFKYYPEYAELTAKWEHGLHGFNTIHFWDLNRLLADKNRKVISGILHDIILGPHTLHKLLKNKADKSCYPKMFGRVNNWGLPAETINRLFKLESYDQITFSIYNRLKQQYLNYSNYEYQRIWCFILYHRTRFHLGGIIWKVTFGGWPVIPVIDRKMLELIGGIPAATILERKAQKSLVKKYFPALASIPLDNNTNKTKPLIPTWKYLLKDKITSSRMLNNKYVNAARYRLQGPRRKNLYYYRILDIDNIGWKKIRDFVENHKAETTNFFNEDVIHEILPPPTQDISKNLGEASGIKTLIGLLIWLKNNQDNLK